MLDIKKIQRIGLIKYIDDLTNNNLAYFNFLVHKIMGKPYFGSYLASVQGKSRRHFYMQQLIYKKLRDSNGEIKILEIGSWAGGSVLTWVEALSEIGKPYKIFCIDPWVNYIEEQGNLWTHKTMKKAFNNDEIYKLFLHNIQSSGSSRNICILRGTTEEMCETLKTNSFDLVFIDGNHAYDFVKKDVELTSKLIKENGILCGDDLELQYHQVDIDELSENKNKDVIFDRTNETNYHPGVTLAVWEFFKNKISAEEGFWFVEKVKNNWKDINLNIKDDVKIPSHLLGEL